jgi:hypothetical protein
MTLEFLWGATAFGACVASLVFLRFWSMTRERLFAFFAAAFALLAINWTLLAALNPERESRHLIYLVRLGAFLLMVGAIVDKNRRP